MIQINEGITHIIIVLIFGRRRRRRSFQKGYDTITGFDKIIESFVFLQTMQEKPI
jgi:hypothetical protein